MEIIMEAVNGVIAEVITILINKDAVIIMAVVISITEFVRKFCKDSKVQERYSRVRALSKWEIRAIAFVLGLGITAIWLSDTWKAEFVYGLFYGGIAPITIQFIKHVLVKKYAPTLYDKWN